jgi:hypothetical protein
MSAALWAGWALLPAFEAVRTVNEFATAGERDVVTLTDRVVQRELQRAQPGVHSSGLVSGDSRLDGGGEPDQERRPGVLVANAAANRAPASTPSRPRSWGRTIASPEGSCQDDRAALGACLVNRGADRRLDGKSEQAADRDDYSDFGLAPMLLGDQEHVEIRPQRAADLRHGGHPQQSRRGQW